MVAPAKFREVARISKFRRVRLGEVLEYHGIAREQIYELLSPMLLDPNPQMSANSRSRYMAPYTDLIRISGASDAVIRAIRQGEIKGMTLATYPALAGLLLACHLLAQNSKTGWNTRFGYPYRLLTQFLRSLGEKAVGRGSELLGQRTGPAKYYYLQIALNFWSDQDFWTNWKSNLNAYLREDLAPKVVEISRRVATALRTQGQAMLAQIPLRSRGLRFVAPTVLVQATDHEAAVKEIHARASLLEASDVAFLLSCWGQCYSADEGDQDTIYGVCHERHHVWGIGFRPEHLLGPDGPNALELKVRWKMDLGAMKLGQNHGF